MHKIPFFYDYVFPNFILPNALPSEMGIVNYLHTLYSNRLSSETFFEDNLDRQDNFLKQMFGEHMGDWPSSVRMGGSYLMNPCYNERVKIYEDSVYFGKRNLHANHFQRYIYPIKVTLHFPRFTGVDRIGNKLNGEYFWKNISADVLQDLKNRNAIIFLDWSNENFIDRGTYCDFHQGLRMSGIPKEQIILSVNSFNAREVYESWFPPEERCLEVRNLPFLISNISYHYNVNRDTRLSEQSWVRTRDNVRKNYFVYPIRRGRDHRLAVLHKLWDMDLLSKADWSCLDFKDPHHGYAVTVNFGFNVDIDKSRDLYKSLPHSLEDEQGSTYFSVHGWNDQHSRYSENAYFYLASETYFHGEYKSLTEKVFKPIVNFQPFLFMAYQGALEELRKMGFKTFSPYIDESYDNEPDAGKRMQMIVNEVSRLCSMSKEEIHNWYWGMQDILLYNHKFFLDLWKNEPHSKEFINYLYRRVVL